MLNCIRMNTQHYLSLLLTFPLIKHLFLSVIYVSKTHRHNVHWFSEALFENINLY